MTLMKASLVFCLLVLVAPGVARAQTDNKVDLKPLIPPILPPVLLPPNSSLTPGSVNGGTQSPYSAPFNDPTQNQATPGLRLSIPTR